MTAFTNNQSRVDNDCLMFESVEARDDELPSSMSLRAADEFKYWLESSVLDSPFEAFKIGLAFSHIVMRSVARMMADCAIVEGK